MEVTVTSAATFAAAILEHQGLLAQTMVLDQFQGFFRDAGALLYLIAGVGAVISVLVYGSFRAPRYLLIGPALFWFLVGPRTGEIEGVVWKLGEGQERGFYGEEDGSATAKQSLMEKLNQDPNFRPNPAQGFWLFASTINEFTNEFIGVLLKNEDRQDLLVASRVYGLEVIAGSNMNDSGQLQRMEQGLMLHCPRMLAAAHAAASAMIKDQAGNAFQGTGTGLRDQIVSKHIEEMKQYGGIMEGTLGRELVPTKTTGFYTMIKSNVEGSGGGSQLARQLVKEDGTTPRDHIRCADAWHLIAEEIWHRAAAGQARAIRVASKALQIPELASDACKQLTDKALLAGVTAEGIADECNIQPAIALSLLNNHLAQPAVYNRVLSRHWNNLAHMNPRSHVVLTAGGHGFGTAQIQNQFLTRMIDGIGRGLTMIGLAREEVLEDGRIRRTTMWGPAMELRQDYGMNHAMWVSTRMYEIANLRQQLYSYALNLPYYQGVLLFIIALTYPFFALLVIVPGKAIAFLNIPMAWLWVKSWDIGFAAVIMLDHIMYNLLPSANVDERLRNNAWTDLELLPVALSQGYNFDPLGSIHTYYSILSFVWLSVPIISGYVTLKAKRGVLSMFSEAPAQIARKSGEAAATAFSLAAQDKRNTMLKEMEGFAKNIPMMGQGGLGGGMPGVVARTLATLDATAKGMSVKPSAVLSDLANLTSTDSATAKEVERLKQAGLSYLSTYQSVVQSQANFQGELLASFDPVLGRWGDLGMMHGAYTAAMDGGGGYELYDHDRTMTSSLVDAYTTNFTTQLNALGDAQDAFIRRTFDAMNSGILGKNRAESGFDFASFTMAAHLLMAEKDNASISDLRVLFGGDGFTDQGYWTMLTMSNPADLGQMRGMTQDNLKQDFFHSYFGVIDPNPAPGGFSEFIGTALSTVGNDRTVEITEARAPEGLLGSIVSTVNGLNSVDGIAHAESGGLGLWNTTTDRAIAADRQFQFSFPKQYQDDVNSRVQGLVQMYGQENITSYFSGINKPIQGEISTQHLWEYSQHVYQTSGLLPEGLSQADKDLAKQHIQINQSYGSHIDTSPRAALEELYFWNRRRGNAASGDRIELGFPSGRALVSDPRQLYILGEGE